MFIFKTKNTNMFRTYLLYCHYIVLNAVWRHILFSISAFILLIFFVERLKISKLHDALLGCLRFVNFHSFFHILLRDYNSWFSRVHHNHGHILLELHTDAWARVFRDKLLTAAWPPGRAGKSSFRWLTNLPSLTRGKWL